MAKQEIWVITLLYCFVYILNVEASPIDEEQEGSRHGSCKPTCLSEERIKQIESKIDASAEIQTKQIGMLEKKLDSLLEQIGVPCKPPKRRCPADFTYDSDSKICIKLFKDRRSWLAADNLCRDLGDGYRLAVLDTEKKFQFVQKFLLESDPRRRSSIWRDQCCVGGKQEDGEGRWVWSTGKKVQQGVWGPRQPDNALGVENCLTMAFASGWPGWVFNDGVCTTRGNFLFICEYELN